MTQLASWLRPRIWRYGAAKFSGDELANAATLHTEEVVRNIREHGFDGVWLRGRLRHLMQVQTFAELNDPGRSKRIEELNKLIARAGRSGMGVYLYFNEPLALPANDPFWQAHPEVRGAAYRSPSLQWDDAALCTSSPQVQRFMAEAIDSVARDLPGLAGVILITASESHTHCWSHHARVSFDDGYITAADQPLDCPRCKDREPADVVIELLNIWEKHIHARQPNCRVMAWNWSWSMWYPDPQEPIVGRIPAGVELMADCERGGSRMWQGRSITVDEYSLAYPGPSPRFCASRELAAKQAIPTHAKLQIGTTHEIATVPNLPLLTSLHRKLVGLREQGVRGALCTWAIGCSLTLNTYAVKIFAEDPERFRDQEVFLRELARVYLGVDEPRPWIEAWRLFSAAFEHQPFSIRMLYFGPINYAPAQLLTPMFRDVPLRGSWRAFDDYGDRLDDCLRPFTLDEVIASYAALSEVWDRGLSALGPAMTALGDGTLAQVTRREQEWSTARMIDCQLRSTLHLFAFHRWRSHAMVAQNLTAPCTVALDDQARQLITREIQNTTTALELCRADRRLGYHDEAGASFYDTAKLDRKLKTMQQLLA